LVRLWLFRIGITLRRILRQYQRLLPSRFLLVALLQEALRLLVVAVALALLLQALSRLLYQLVLLL
jgi:hypothetical protein